MKIAILIESPKISGGSLVIYKHAIWLRDNNHEVVFVTEKKVNEEDIAWYPDVQKMRWCVYEDIEKEQFDITMATWCMTVYKLTRINSKKYVYFVQSIESRFFDKRAVLEKYLADATYSLPVFYITEATWIKDFLFTKYGQEAYLVKNGIDRDVFSVKGDRIGTLNDGKIRVLVEGDIDAPYKNVRRTVELCNASNADEIWLMTSSDIHDFPGCDKVFSQVPYNQTSKIYRSCDILVKLSYVEGMFGPPLEMFQCGGTAVVYDVTGYDEYIINGYNAIVVPANDEGAVVEAINKLKSDKTMLNAMKLNALKTADEWIDWDTSSKQFAQCLYDINNRDDLYDTKKLNALLQTIRGSVESKFAIRCAKRKAKEKYPKLYKLCKNTYNSIKNTVHSV